MTTHRAPTSRKLRSTTRVLLVLVVLTLVSATAAFAVSSGWAGALLPGGASETGRLAVLPPVAQPGNDPAPADAAHTALVATFEPATVGGVVLLQRQEGEDWVTVSSAQQGPDGRALFNVRSPGGEGAPTYRATSLGQDGSPEGSTNTVDPGDWELVFDDEFEGRALDPAKWAYRHLGLYNPGNRTCAVSDEGAVAVAQGTLRLKVLQDPERIGEVCETPDYGSHPFYQNGHVATAGLFDFTYGVAAARVKFPRERGQHGGFWLQPTAPVLTPGDPSKSGAEIDVVEFFGDDFPDGGLASFTYHLNKAGDSEKVGGVWPEATAALPPGDDWWRSYHVFSVEWTPEQYVFRIDGREVFRSDKGISGTNQYLILSLLTSDWELPKLDDSSLPSSMHVDWVRAWQLRGGS